MGQAHENRVGSFDRQISNKTEELDRLKNDRESAVTAQDTAQRALEETAGKLSDFEMRDTSGLEDQLRNAGAHCPHFVAEWVWKPA